MSTVNATPTQDHGVPGEVAADVLVTRDGMRLTVRPIQPDDKGGLARGFERLSEESRYRRFLAPIKRLTSSDLTYLTELDHRDHEALVAVTPGKEIVGVARYVRLGERSTMAEVAVTVADEWQQRGIGTGLLQRLARRANVAGIHTFVGICLASNSSMIQLLRELDPAAAVVTQGPGVVEVDVELPTTAPRRRIADILRDVARTGSHAVPMNEPFRANQRHARSSCVAATERVE